MGNHRVNADISEESLAALTDVMATGDFESQGELMDEAILSFAEGCRQNDGTQEVPEWFREDIIATSKEMDAHPERCFTSEQLSAFLEESRQTLAKAS